jgi:hypothetical protein
MLVLICGLLLTPGIATAAIEATGPTNGATFLGPDPLAFIPNYGGDSIPFTATTSSIFEPGRILISQMPPDVDGKLSLSTSVDLSWQDSSFQTELGYDWSTDGDFTSPTLPGFAHNPPGLYYWQGYNSVTDERTAVQTFTLAEPSRPAPISPPNNAVIPYGQPVTFIARIDSGIPDSPRTWLYVGSTPDQVLLAYLHKANCWDLPPFGSSNDGGTLVGIRLDTCLRASTPLPPGTYYWSPVLSLYGAQYVGPTVYSTVSDLLGPVSRFTVASPWQADPRCPSWRGSIARLTVQIRAASRAATHARNKLARRKDLLRVKLLSAQRNRLLKLVRSRLCTP